MNRGKEKGKQVDGGGREVLVGNSWQGTRLAGHLSSLANLNYSQGQ